MKKNGIAFVIVCLIMILCTSAVYAASNDEIRNSILYAINEKDGVQVSQLNDTIILEGIVPSLDGRSKAEEIAKLYSGNVLNYITVNNAEQVRLDVMVLEVDREKVGDLGIQWGSNTAGGFVPGAFFIGQGITNNIINSASKIGYANIQAKVKALIAEGHSRLLSAPAVVTSNGGVAFVRVGGSLPIPQGVGQNYGIEWKDYGVKLTVTPKVQPGGYINTDVNVDIRDIDPLSVKNSVQISNGTQTVSIPIFKNNKAQANLNLRVGETMALGGLLSYELNNDTEGIAGLANIPMLGSLFKDTARKHSAVDVVVLVTPTLVYSTSQPDLSSSSEGAKAHTGKSLYDNRVDITQK